MRYMYGGMLKFVGGILWDLETWHTPNAMCCNDGQESKRKPNLQDRMRTAVHNLVKNAQGQPKTSLSDSSRTASKHNRATFELRFLLTLENEAGDFMVR